MTSKKCAASSCAVENIENRLQLKFSFYAVGDYTDTKQAFQRNSQAFSIDVKNTREGSSLVVFANAACARQACADMEKVGVDITQRHRITCKNGSEHPCASVSEAIEMAFTHR